MSVKYLYNGTNQPDTTTRIKGPIVSATSAADGSVSETEVIVNDPTGVLVYDGLQDFAIEEDTGSPARLWTGKIAELTVERGPYLTGKGRIYRFKLADLNTLLHWDVFRAATAKRPAETGDARLAWLLAALDGLVYDNGLVAANSQMYGEADYRGKYADVVLPDISFGSNTFGVYYDPVAAQPSLLYQPTTAAVHSSTLRLSTVPSDCDDIDDPSATTFYMHPSPTLARAAQGIYCGVWFVYKGVPIYRHSATTHAAYFGSSTHHRDGVYETDRIGKLATANLNAAAFLASHSGLIDTITCTVKLPASKVSLIDTGMRIQVRFENFPGGYDGAGFTWTRVARRSFLLSEGTNRYFDVQLELSTRGITGTGGGSSGDFPHVPSVATIIQSSEGLSNRTFASAPAVGDTLIYVGGRRHDTFNATGINTYTIGPDGEAVEPTYDDRCAVFHRLADGTESATLITGDQNGRGVWLEFDGEWTVDAHAEATNNLGGGPSTGSPTAGAITVAPNSLVFAVVAMGEGGGWDAGSGSIHFTPAAGFTELSDGGVFDGHPSVWVGYLFSAAGGSISAAPTCTNASIAWATQIVSFVGANGPTPPAPGQWVYDEVPTPVADGSTTTFTLANTFADGSLLVKVDRLDQTAAVTSYDGTAGTFTLGFAPRTGELIEVTYQGR